MQSPRASLSAVVVAFLVLAGCAPVPDVFITSGGERLARVDEAVALRASGARDLACDAQSITLGAMSLGGSSVSSVRANAHIELAEGCGRRATYASTCGWHESPQPPAEPELPEPWPGADTTERLRREHAARPRRVGRYVLLSRVELAPPPSVP